MASCCEALPWTTTLPSKRSMAYTGPAYANTNSADRKTEIKNSLFIIRPPFVKLTTHLLLPFKKAIIKFKHYVKKFLINLYKKISLFFFLFR
jgi:hypothetical protein